MPCPPRSGALMFDTCMCRWSKWGDFESIDGLDGDQSIAIESKTDAFGQKHYVAVSESEEVIYNVSGPVEKLGVWGDKAEQFDGDASFRRQRALLNSSLHSDESEDEGHVLLAGVDAVVVDDESFTEQRGERDPGRAARRVDVLADDNGTTPLSPYDVDEALWRDASTEDSDDSDSTSLPSLAVDLVDDIVDHAAEEVSALDAIFSDDDRRQIDAAQGDGESASATDNRSPTPTGANVEPAKDDHLAPQHSTCAASQKTGQRVRRVPGTGEIRPVRRTTRKKKQSDEVRSG